MNNVKGMIIQTDIKKENVNSLFMKMSVVIHFLVLLLDRFTSKAENIAVEDKVDEVLNHSL